MPKKIKKQPRTTKLLLSETVKNVGRVGDVVTVGASYARNFLVPEHLGVIPTAGNVARIEEKRKEIERQEKELRDQQAAMLAKLGGVEVTLQRRANEQGHLFGSVTASDISHGLAEQGFNVEPTDINLPGKLDRVDKYEVEVSFADDLNAMIKVYVAPDAESKEAIDAYQKRQAEIEAERAAAAPPAEPAAV